MKTFVMFALAASLALLGTVVETEAGGVTVHFQGTTGPSQHWQHPGHVYHHRRYVYVPQPRAQVYYVPAAPAYTVDPRWHWDGLRWWFWDGYRWVAY